MVCKHCGSQLSISDKKCPFCGMENTAAAEHHKAMSSYEKKFDRTRDEVLQEVKKSKKNIGMIVAIILLSLANIFVVIARKNAYEIEYYLKEKELLRDADEIQKQVCVYIEEENYIGLYAYLQEKDVEYLEDMRHYEIMRQSAMCYKMILEAVAVLQGDMSDYRTELEVISYLASYIRQLYDMVQRDYFAYRIEEYYTEDAVRVLEDVQEKCEVILQAYLNVSEEQLSEMQTMEKQEMEYILGKGLGLYE